MMAIGFTRREPRAHAGRQQLLAAVSHQHQLPAHYVDEFVLRDMPMTQRGCGPGFERGQIDAEVSQPERVAQPLLGASRDHRLELRRIVGAVARDDSCGIESG